MNDGQNKKSLSEFDYFSERHKVVSDDTLDGIEDLPSGLEGQLLSLRARQKRITRSIVASLLFFLVVTFFLFSFRADIEYLFSTSTTPKQMGDASSISAAMLKPGSYVQLSGITVVRTAAVKYVRHGVGLGRDTYILQPIAGARGVFVELPMDEKYKDSQSLDIRGRVIDPFESRAHRGFFEDYQDHFFRSPRPATVRLIQYGLVPRSHRGGYFVMFALFALVGLFNIFTLWRFARLRQEQSLLDTRSAKRP